MMMVNDNVFNDLIRQIQLHVDQENGMTNQSVHALCTQATRLISVVGGKTVYQGTFSADKIPISELLRFSSAKEFSLVINLQKSVDVSKQPTGHFVTVIGCPEYTLYIDPFGLPCIQENVRDFLFKRQLPVYYSSSVIQESMSVFCGLYCLLFISYFYQWPRWNLKFETDTKKLKMNDDLCLYYLNKLFSSYDEFC